MAIDIKEFVRTRVKEFDPEIETREGTPVGDIFISSLDFILQPFVDQLAATQINQSLRLILQQTDPDDDIFEEPTDDFAANLFVTRKPGSKTRVVGKVFYSSPVDREFPTGTAQLVSGVGNNYLNTEPFSISKSQMTLQRENSLYYFEINVEAEEEGEAYNLLPGDLVGLTGDGDVVSVTNELSSSVIGSDKETNTQLINRTKNSIAVRDLNVGKGINGILFENFPELDQIFPVGFQDPEMQRDILFNAHIGGYTDIYVKTPSFTIKEDSFVALAFDSTREVPTADSKQINATDFSDPDASLGNPFIVFGTLRVTETAPSLAAEVDSLVIPITGIDLVDQNKYIKLQIDNNAPVNIKMSGANPTSTTINEMVNAINAAVGFDVATPIGQTKLRITSLNLGSTGQVSFHVPDLPRDDATFTLFGFNAPNTTVGFSPVEPIEGVDFEVDYEDGKIIKLASVGPTRILSGETIMGPRSDGVATAGERTLKLTFGGFVSSQVEIGDDVFIAGGTGVIPGTYRIDDVVDDNEILLDIGFSATTNTGDIEFTIVSNKVYSISYAFNPLSIDIGNLVKLDDIGRDRGIRPGREDFTIQNMAFIDALIIEEIDPETGEGLGVFLRNIDGTGDAGYGAGGYGLGPYGIGDGAQVYLEVNEPHDRFSAFEDSMFIFAPELFGKSYKITYLIASEIPTIHEFARSDDERVTDANILMKHFLPSFVDMEIEYEIDPTVPDTPDNSELTQRVEDFISGLKSGVKLESNDIIKLLEEAVSLRVPFEMKARTLTPNASIEILSSTDFLLFPEKDLDSQTDNPTTRNIVRFVPGNITLTRVETSEGSINVF